MAAVPGEVPPGLGAVLVRERPGSGRLVVPALLVAALAVFVAVLLITPAGDGFVVPFDDVVTSGGAWLAAVAAAAAAARSSRDVRRGWALVALSWAGWAAGQTTWSVFELALHRPVPFPSVADVGFLTYPVAGAAALYALTGRGTTSARRLQAALDGALVGTGLLTLSWLTVLGPVFHAGADSHLALVISVAYPVGDVLVGSLALLALSRTSQHRDVRLLLLAASPCAMAVADSAFAYLTSAGTYATGRLSDTGWLLAALLVVSAAHGAGASAPLVHRNPAAEPATLRAPVADGARWRVLARRDVWLPYVPFAAAIGAAGWTAAHGSLDPFTVALAVLLVALMLARQLASVADNLVLLREVQAREEEVRWLAFHDPLTGLANRALFTDRLQHAAVLAHRAGGSVCVMYCDLDGFKQVNDVHGHTTGDRLLASVAERLRGALRSGDTLARLGGDEFAVLLAETPGAHGPADAHRLRERIREALVEPFLVSAPTGPVTITAACSVGWATLPAGPDPAATASALLHAADEAMYRQKSARRPDVA
ncbi:MAG: diguanylate cyclase domain-containing protein [Motilibacteraceae bacterium]